MSGFTEANDIYIDVAMTLAERAILAALDSADVKPADVDVVFSTTVTGLAVPTVEARLATRIGLRPDVKRVPLFGLGCVAGAAGVARMHDYLLAFPDHVGVLLAVELCSLTLQRDDSSIANLVASSLFGDGAAAVVGKGGNHSSTGPRVLATRSRIYPDTEDVMGWDIGSNGFKIKLSTEVATVAEKYLGEDVRNFLNDHGLSTTDISTWVCHPGGPKVIEAIENTLDLPADALGSHSKVVTRQRKSVVGVGARRSPREPGRSTATWIVRAYDRHGPGVLLGTRAARLVGRVSPLSFQRAFQTG